MFRPSLDSLTGKMIANNETQKIKNRETFARLCTAARECNELALRRMKDNEQIDITYRCDDIDSETVTMVMAKEGNEKAVQFLMDNFKGTTLNDAIQGYAKGGHVKKVDELRLKHNLLDDAVLGYAAGNHMEQVKVLINCGASIAKAAAGYGKNGHSESLRLLIESINKEADLNAISIGLFGLGEALHTHLDEAVITAASKAKETYSTQPGQLRKLISKPNHLATCCRYTFNGYMHSGAWMNMNNTFELLIRIQNDDIYRHYVTFIRELAKELTPYLADINLNEFLLRADGVRAKRNKNPEISIEAAYDEVIKELSQPKPSRLSLFHHKNEAAATKAAATEVAASVEQQLETPVLK